MHPRALVAITALTAVLAGCSDDERDASPPESPASSGASSAMEISLPESLGDLQSYEAGCAEIDGDEERCLESAAGAGDSVLAAADNLSAAYGDAAATGRVYATDGFEGFVRVLVVAAPSPGLWSAESEASAEVVGLGHPREWVEERDGVQCLAMTTNLVREGEELDPDDIVVLRCQESGPALTVVLFPGGDATLDDAFGWTSEAFDAS